MKRKVNHNINYVHTKSNFSGVLDLFSGARLKLKQRLYSTMLWELHLF